MNSTTTSSTLAQPSATEAPTPNDAPSPRAWSYPFPKDAQHDVTNPQTFFGAFARMDDGYFPLGVNGLPHGGVHFGAATAQAVDQDGGVRCLADGQIVAYKLDAAYPQLEFTQNGRWALYSTGFVLVRHRLSVPAPDTIAEPLTQTLYSLYLHLADWATYVTDNQLKRPGWWHADPMIRIGNADRYPGGKGARVRTAPTAAGHGHYRAGSIFGYLPEGTDVQIGERRGSWACLQYVSQGVLLTQQGEPSTDPLAADTGWIYLPEQHTLAEPDGVGSVVIPPEPILVKAGDVLGHIGAYTDYERSNPLPPDPIRPLLHVEVFADSGFEAFLQKSRQRAQTQPDDHKTLLTLQPGAQLVQTVPPPDTTVGADHPWGYPSRVKATADSPTDGRWAKVHGLHCNTMGFYEPGEPRWIKRCDLATATAATRAWSTFPLSTRNLAEPANGHLRIFALSELDALPEDAKARDDKGNRWRYVDYGTADGKTAHGWMLDKHHPHTERVSPWAWPGFEIVDATGIDLVDAFKRNVIVCGGAESKEVYAWESSVQAMEASLLFKKLEQTVGVQHYSENNHLYINPNTGLVTPKALQTALRHPWLAQTLSRLILKYESEWGGNMARWEALTPWMGEARENWQCEMQRIRALQWWDEVKGRVEGFPESPVVYHIHPIALVGNFYRHSDLITFEMLKACDASLDDAYIEKIVPYLNKYAIAYSVNTKMRIAHFLSQVYVESRFKNQEEQLSYSAKRMRQIFGCEGGEKNYISQMDECRSDRLRGKLWTNEDVYVHNPKSLANYVYASREGNGDEASGDGYKYRGRGLMQITGKNKYSLFSRQHNMKFPSDYKDFVYNPGLLLTDLEYGIESAFVFWCAIREVNKIADSGSVLEVTMAVNGGQNGLSDRRAAFNKIASVLGLDLEG